MYKNGDISTTTKKGMESTAKKVATNVLFTLRYNVRPIISVEEKSEGKGMTYSIKTRLLSR